MTCDTLDCIYAIKCQGCDKMYFWDTNNLGLRTLMYGALVPVDIF